ncbi:lycopene cyclase domain-containing protein [Lysinibacter sp. HNR]|uniref:lycopene cyclase domain-containing protein n=1 Tax=Lysinibacter sp. HNR TaxID=3031408 RepID=UPI0024352573|nr:lycopene cyclase domain-containing protein [Lysinibacter sp. HNR]WGD36411.1 lycopene cyclase domain-containing protein [Lysinibacter sp. HNR]
MGVLYLASLLTGIGCMLILDRRFRLFFWHDPLAAMIITSLGTVLFLFWDLAGIATGIFLRGDSIIATGIVLAPEMPIEEPVFLIFLVLCIMVVYTSAVRLLGLRTRDRA